MFWSSEFGKIMLINMVAFMYRFTIFKWLKLHQLYQLKIIGICDSIVALHVVSSLFVNVVIM